MKKLFLPIIAICLIFNNIDAQDDRPIRIAFAIQPATSWLVPEGDILEKDANRLAFSYGIITDFTIAGNPNYAFSTGVLINSQGGTITNPMYHDGETTMFNKGDSTTTLIDEFAESTEKYRLQYLDIPLTLKLKTNEIGYFTYYGQFGLDLSFNIKARQDIDYKFPSEPEINKEDINISEDISFFRTALQVGAGVEYNISGDTYLVGGIVWNNGLNNVFSDKNFVKANDDGEPEFTGNNALREGEKMKVTSNYIGLTLGVFF
ncbi:MAG: PorT family protein [Flavobacteriales bacterium]|nr:PorT family protein [Flavobacteriales bacterium]NNK80862.1 PorT family protein [Flavobacteriales bacterium]